MESGVNRNWIYIAFCGIVTLDLFVGLGSLYLWIVVFHFLLFLSGLLEAGVILVMCSSQLIGFIASYYGLEGIAGLPIILGLAIQLLRGRLSLNRTYIVVTLVFLSWLTLSSTSASEGWGHWVKLGLLTKQMIYYSIVFSVLFNSDKINLAVVGYFFIISSLLCFHATINLTTATGPEGVLDFEWMRWQTYAYSVDSVFDVGDLKLSYHLPGFWAVFGLVMILVSNTYIHSTTKLALFLVVLLIVLHSGARQNMISFALVFFFWLIRSLSKSNVFRAFGLLVFIIVFLLFPLLNLSAYWNGLAESDERALHWVKALEMFRERPLVGYGFGYHDYGGNGRWPHNFYLEVLAELGLVGLTLVIVPSLHVLISKVIFRAFSTRYSLVFIPFFIRALLSGSLATNVSLLVLFFFANSKRLLGEL